MPTERRWPLEPLVKALGGTHHQVVWQCGVSGSTVAHWAEVGLSDQQADRSAVRAGLNAVDVWPDWYEAVPKVDILFGELREQVG